MEEGRELDLHAQAWPKEGRLIGIDYGTVRVGLAICDPSRTFTGPLNTYQRRNPHLDAQYFQKVAQAESIVGWVVGLPIHCDGQESQKSAEARAFGAWLNQLTALPVRFVDERFSTAMANRLLASASLTRKQTKQRVDRIAAHVILESFLETSRHSQQVQGEAQALDDLPP